MTTQNINTLYKKYDIDTIIDIPQKKPGNIPIPPVPTPNYTPIQSNSTPPVPIQSVPIKNEVFGCCGH